MATGAPTTLWHMNVKINCASRGFNFKAHFANTGESLARSRGTDLCKRLRKLMPVSANLYFATISNDGTKKDSRFLPGAVGDGEYAPGSPGVPAKHDYSKTAVLVRFEHSDGASVTRKVNPIPDEIITNNVIIDEIDDLEDIPADPIPAPGAADWKTEFYNFMWAFVKNTHHVVSNHEPGGEYTYFAWEHAYVLRVGDKKGGRDFV